MNRIRNSRCVSTILIFIQKKCVLFIFDKQITVYQTLDTVHRKLSIRPIEYPIDLASPFVTT